MLPSGTPLPTIYQVAGWLGDCVGLYFVLLLGWTLWKGRRPIRVQRWIHYAADYSRRDFKVPVTFSLFVMTGLILQVARANSAPVSEQHNVAVLAKLSSNEWRMRSDEEGEFVYRACPDFDNESVIWAGYVADRARWREYGRCKSIRDTGLGFWWRVGHDEYRKVD